MFRRKPALFLSIPLLSLLLSFSGWANDPTGSDDLHKLVSGTETEQTAASEAIAARGLSSAPALVSLLNAIKPASDTLAAIGHNLRESGTPEDRKEFSKLLMSLLERDRAMATKAVGLDLLAVGVPEGVSLRPIGKLLADEDLKERARRSLVGIGGNRARSELQDILLSGKVEDLDFYAAVIDSLSPLEENEFSRAIYDHAFLHSDSRLRVAGARAYARSGEPKHLAAILKSALRGNSEGRAGLLDCFFELGEKVAQDENRRPSVVASYQVLLQGGTADEKKRALEGLSRHGGVDQTDGLLLKLNYPNSPEITNAILDLLVEWDDEGLTEKIKKAYGNVDESAKEPTREKFPDLDLDNLPIDLTDE